MKKTLLYSILFGFGSIYMVSACKKSNREFMGQRSSYLNEAPGAALLTLTPSTAGFVDIEINVFGGSPLLPTQCSYAIYDGQSDDAALLSNQFIYLALDQSGAALISVPNNFCSIGKTTAYVTWDCSTSVFPFTPALATNEGSNAFFFECPN